MGKPMDRSNRFLSGTPRSFSEVFPTLEDVLVESHETGSGTRYQIGRAAGSAPGHSPLHSLRGYGGLIPCSNPLCCRGGYEIESDLYSMVRRKLVSKEFRRPCPGDEGSPKGRRPGTAF